MRKSMRSGDKRDRAALQEEGEEEDQVMCRENSHCDPEDCA